MSNYDDNISVSGEFKVSIPGESITYTAEDDLGFEEPVQPPKRTPKKMHNKQLGARGEEAAARFLERRGYLILERNWCCDLGEVDIVALDDDCLVFVEVKTRMDEDRGLPEEAVGEEKRQRYERMAIYYLKGIDAMDIQVRFDIIGILVMAPDRAMIRHHINAFGIC